MSKNTLIFIVDDDPMQLDMLKDHLSAMSNFNIYTFSNGEECLAQIDKNCSDPVTVTVTVTVPVPVPVPEYIPEQAMAAPSFKQQRLQRQNAFRCTAPRCDEIHWQCCRHAGSLPFPRR